MAKWALAATKNVMPIAAVVHRTIRGQSMRALGVSFSWKIGPRLRHLESDGP